MDRDPDSLPKILALNRANILDIAKVTGRSEEELTELYTDGLSQNKVVFILVGELWTEN